MEGAKLALSPAACMGHTSPALHPYFFPEALESAAPPAGLVPSVPLLSGQTSLSPEPLARHVPHRSVTCPPFSLTTCTPAFYADTRLRTHRGPGGRGPEKTLQDRTQRTPRSRPERSQADELFVLQSVGGRANTATLGGSREAAQRTRLGK